MTTITCDLVELSDVTDARYGGKALGLAELSSRGFEVPAAFVMLEALPLNANGKIDRGQLPEPSASATAQAPYAPPAPGTEATLAQVWQDLLGVQQVGRDDSFFDLGGDSILLIRMLGRVRERNIALGVADVYRLRTVQAMRRSRRFALASLDAVLADIAARAAVRCAWRWRVATRCC